MIVMKVDLINAGKRQPTPSLMAVQPACYSIGCCK